MAAPSTLALRLSVAAPHADVRRVLVIRCCRLPVLETTLAWVRQQCPAATIDILSSPGFDAELHAAGAARVFHYAGGHLRLWRHARLLGTLRGHRYDLVVVPQMADADASYANVHRVALATGAPRVVVAAPGRELRSLDPSRLRRFTLRTTLLAILPVFDPALLLMLLALAWLLPRRAPRSTEGRRRVLHVITTFGVGGAQVQLAELLARTPPDRYDVAVLALDRHDGNFSRQWLRGHEATIRYAAAWPSPTLVTLEIARECRRGRYDLVHTWLFMANVVGAAGARLGGVPRIIGSVRNLSLWKRTWYRQWWYRLADALATRVADVVTVNAGALVADHARWTWFSAGRLEVVHNGLDPAAVVNGTDGARDGLRMELRLAADTPLVGTVGRLAPEKDHETFIRAFARARAEQPALHGVIAGDGELRPALTRLAGELGVADALHFLGARRDSRRIIAGLDVFALTSRIEGFPNVLLEAAFLGVPAVATGVGGAADLLDPDDLAAPGDIDAIARRLAARVARPEAARFHAASTRRRALEQFTAEHTTVRWLALYDRLMPVKETLRED